LDPSARELAGRAGSGLAELAELARDLRAYRESLAVDPSRLQEVRERIAALKGLQRKYGSTDLEVLAFLTEASARLATLAGADERLATLAHDVQELSARASELAGLVTAGREEASPRLAAALAAEINDLGMPEAILQVALEPRQELAAAGAERVDLRLGAGPGQDPMPLVKAASGGELSRTMLACRSVLADLDDVPTLVFDEVDAGIGGQAGLAVGRRLARLARGRQVVVVTHLPQIACFADRHVLVEKERGTATIRVLSDEERVRELSRMLAGLPGTDRAVSHAEELLVEAGKVRASH
jgi:DNA repair protein RecN (Recombination protein N)